MKFTKKQLLDLIKEEVVGNDKLKQLQERKNKVESKLNKLKEEGFEFIDEWVEDKMPKSDRKGNLSNAKDAEEVEGKKKSDDAERWYYPDLEDEKSEELNEEKPSSGLSKEKKSAVVKKAKAGEDIGKKGKGFKAVAAKATKEYGSKEKGEK